MADDSEESVDTDPETNHETESGDDTADNASADTADADEDEKSFRERVEEIRQRRNEEHHTRARPEPDEMMGGGGGGNPFAQMMSGMMGGGGPGAGAGAGGPGMGDGDDSDNEEVVREIRQLRDEVRDATRQLQRIAQAVEDLTDN